MKKQVNSSKAPRAIGPYSQGVRTGSLLFLSGQIPMNPDTGEIETGTIQDQTWQVLSNLQELLHAENLTTDNVVKVSVFLKDMNDFAALNAVYAEVFDMEVPPARECVEVSRLPRDVAVEISLIAEYPESQ